MLQEQLQCERQQFEAGKLEMENKTLAFHSQVSQPQIQGTLIISSGPTIKFNLSIP